MQRETTVCAGRSVVFASLCALALVVGSCASSGPDPEAYPVVVPAGDPELGREVFLRYRCDVCHRVVGDPDLQMPTLEPAGPDLGLAVARAGAGRLISSIVAPSHELAIEEAWEQQGLSPMPGFNERLTVAELLDLVAYLETESTGSGLR
jgi:mono/diheme cytochrome c family protein